MALTRFKDTSNDTERQAQSGAILAEVRRKTTQDRPRIEHCLRRRTLALKNNDMAAYKYWSAQARQAGWTSTGSGRLVPSA